MGVGLGPGGQEVGLDLAHSHGTEKDEGCAHVLKPDLRPWSTWKRVRGAGDLGQEPGSPEVFTSAYELEDGEHE